MMTRWMPAVPVSMVMLAGVLLAGCGTWMSRGPGSTPPLLAQADEQLVAEKYSRALELYDQFLETQAQDPAVPRVRATRTVISRLITTQATLDRARQTLATQEQALTERQRETERLRVEAERLKTERERLRVDLERLRNIDLKEPRR